MRFPLLPEDDDRRPLTLQRSREGALRNALAHTFILSSGETLDRLRRHAEAVANRDKVATPIARRTAAMIQRLVPVCGGFNGVPS